MYVEGVFSSSQGFVYAEIVIVLPVVRFLSACVTDIQEGGSKEQLWITVKPFIQ